MSEKDLERSEWLGVIGAGLVAAAITALAMPSPARSLPGEAGTAPACTTPTDAQASACRSEPASLSLGKQRT